MLSALSIIPAIVTGVSALLLIYTYSQGVHVRAGRHWLTLLLISVGLTGVLLSGDLFPRTFMLAVGLAGLASLLTIALSMLTVQDLVGRPSRVFGLIGIAWAAVFGAISLIAPSKFGQPGWVGDAFTQPDPLAWYIIGSLLSVYLLLTGFSLRRAYLAKLPETANRALLWGLVSVISFASILLFLSASTLLVQAGALLLLLTACGAAYAQTKLDAINLRRHISTLFRLSILTIIAALTIGLGSLISTQLGLPGGFGSHSATLSMLAILVVAAFYVPVHQTLDRLLLRLDGSAPTDSAAAARRYSQQITRSVDMRQLAQTIASTLSEITETHRAALVLANAPDAETGEIALRMISNSTLGEAAREIRGKLSQDSPILKRWREEQFSLTQYEVESHPRFQHVSAKERAFLQETGMSAYAPILIDNALIGILAVGPKRDENPFSRQDLDLLSTMADQTGVALRNARLLADLQHLNDDMQVLNRGLEATKVQMEKLDAVKTDFITIASHELRTPLAQIRGYVDLADALNDQGIVDQDRLSGMIDNIRKASERMEELIGAMLDVSQLDVKTMDLRFNQTSLESILRMAIEPLADAARQRKLSLIAKGLRGLPMIEADMQRLVQAFRNVVVNAIKFTPDGGRIDISAEVEKREPSEGGDRVIVRIADTGVGIDKNDLELIFRKFYRASDPSLHSTGTYKFMGAGPGLGLTIARGVIEGHGGRIWVESPGHDMESCPGSVFFIALPVQPPETAQRVMRFDSGEGYTSSPLDTTIIAPTLR